VNDESDVGYPSPIRCETRAVPLHAQAEALLARIDSFGDPPAALRAAPDA
jgi:hypothetical protein